MVKKAISILLILMTVLSVLSFNGCADEDDSKLTVICSVFPVYDWARNIVGDNEGVELRLLISNGADPHSYQPTAEDVLEVRSADVMLRIGGESDGFINELLKNAPKVLDLKLMEVEGITLCHTAKESHGHSHDDGHDHATDEHIWLSLKNAATSVDAITKLLAKEAPEYAEEFHKNAEDYKKKLTELDEKYSGCVENAAEKKMIFADRFPFVYMTEDYHLEYAAAFEGCSTESEASFETVIQLADKLREWELKVICITESSTDDLAKRVISSAGISDVSIVVFDSMQSVNARRISDGETYIGIMEKNLISLCTALGSAKT